MNRLIASRKHTIPTEATVFIPTATRPKIVLPGTLYLAQNGDIYRLSDGFFTDLHLPTTSGSWMQPAYLPNSQDIVAVLRAAQYSNLYLLSSQGSIIRRLSNNATCISYQPDLPQPLDVLSAHGRRRQHHLFQL